MHQLLFVRTSPSCLIIFCSQCFVRFSNFSFLGCQNPLVSRLSFSLVFFFLILSLGLIFSPGLGDLFLPSVVLNILTLSFSWKDSGWAYSICSFSQKLIYAQFLVNLLRYPVVSTLAFFSRVCYIRLLSGQWVGPYYHITCYYYSVAQHQYLL